MLSSLIIIYEARTQTVGKKNNLVQSGVTVTSSVPGIPQILSVIIVNGVFLQSTLNLAESYNPEQIVEKIFKLKFQCKTYISKEKNSKDAPPLASLNNAE